MKIIGIIITTVIVLAIIAVSTTTAAALSCSGDICVDPTGWQRDGGAFNASTTPIQAAVDNANAGETICVAAGNYFENVDITTPHLTLRGAGADVVTVTAANPSDHVFYVTADYVNISWFTATGATAGFPYYVAGISSAFTDHCNISENNCSNNDCGIYLYHSSNNTLTNNTADSNNNGSIRLYESSKNTLTNNTANSNSNKYKYGICLSRSSGNTLASNTANSNNGGIWLHSSSNNTLLGNTADSNTAHGIYLTSSSNCNTLMSNTASNNNYYGIQMWVSCNYNTLANNIASNNWRGIYMYSSCDNDVTCNLVQNNTDSGIYLTSGSTGNNITWNNIVANGELQTDGSYHYQFKNSQSDGVDAINNFWGAGMNNDTIDASIYKMGSAVEFCPFETEPVPCAPAPLSEELSAFTTVDAVIALEMAVGSCPLDLCYDVSGDGQVTSLDALMIAMDARTG